MRFDRAPFRASFYGVRRAVLLLLVAACGSKEPPKVEERASPEPAPRRMIEPPKKDIRALPPHAIAPTGVGPYKLGMPMAQILSTLPSGPRIALLQIQGVLDYSVARDEGLVVGGERQGEASFIAVVKVGIARTTDGIGVGAETAALAKSLGPTEDDGTIARDPRLWVGQGLPAMRFVTSGGRVVAMLLAAQARTAPRDDGAPRDEGPPCVRKPPPSDALVGIVPIPASARGACLDGADAVVAIGDLVAVLSSSEGKVRRVASLELAGLRWVAPIRGAGGRDELVAVSQRATTDERAFVVTALAVEGGRLVKLGEIEAYRLSETSAAWIGASLTDLDLYLEVSRQGGDLTIGGLLINSAGGTPVDVAPLLPVTLRTRRLDPDRDRARPDAGAAAPDAGTDGGP